VFLLVGNVVSHIHRGNWRDNNGDTLSRSLQQYYCAVDGESLTGSNCLCEHGDSVIEASHWSCCGAIDPDAAECVTLCQVIGASAGWFVLLQASLRVWTSFAF
jgi:hypothetical protein